MADTDKLKEHGWYLSEEGLNVLGVNGSIGDIKAFIRGALDVDLREISAGSFPEELGKAKLDCVPGKIVVQIQKIRNISAPKANEESQAAPRMLKLSLSDGQTCCQAIEMEHISSISLNTPPGTKLFLKTDLPMAHGILLLTPSCVEVLGGKVPHLVEKWELNRSLAKHTRGRVGEEGGPPPWIPFGEKILRVNSQDRNFKSLDTTKDKENRDNTEFEAQRKDAIAEAARGGAKKVFGGGNKPLLDHNVQQIVDHGFSVEQAEYALRLFRNSVDRALKSLQKKEDGQRRDDRERERRGEVRVKEERPERRKRGVREEEAGAPPKPSGKVTLFDFFEDKLPVQNDKELDPRNFVSNGGIVTGVDRRLANVEQQTPRSVINSKGSRPERMPSHPQQQPQQQQQQQLQQQQQQQQQLQHQQQQQQQHQQQHQQQQQQQQQQHQQHQHQQHQQQQQHHQHQQPRRGGSRGGGNSGTGSGGSSGRGGRGSQMSNSSNTWGGAGDVRGSGSGPMGYTHREERPDRGRHPVGQGGGMGNQTQALPPQKPPRFQNQQRLQQPQHQQHHQQHSLQHQHQHQQHQHQQHQQHQHHQSQSHQQHPHHHQQHQQHQQQQQPQHQLNQDSGYGQQSWLSAYNDSYSNDNWPIGSTVNNGKLRDDYVNHGDSYLSNYDSGRNMASRPGYTAGYDMGLEGQVNRGLGMKMDRLAGGRQFASQQDALTQKLSSLQVQGGLGRDGFGYSSRPQGPSAQQNQLYNMNYSYKDPSPTPAQPLGSPPGLSSPPGYGGGNSGGGVYNAPSNHFLSEQKPWQWHEGDKCMAKYWEDNMYYNAEVTGVSERTCVVRFVEYGNFEEVLQDHCIPFTQDELGQTIQSSSAFNSSSDTLSAQNNNQNHFSGVLEFRRGGTRPYVKGGSSSGVPGPGGSERKAPRAQQQMYVPPAQRK